MTHGENAGKSASQNNSHPGREKYVTLNSRDSEPLGNLYEAPLAFARSPDGEGPQNEEPEQQQQQTGWTPLHLPVDDYIHWAIFEAAKLRDSDLRWQTDLWWLIRLLKAHPKMMKRSGLEACRTVTAAMRRWLGVTGTKTDPWATLDTTQDDAETAFADAWDQVRHLPGRDPFQGALAMAEAYPLELPWKHRQGRPSVYERFVSLAGWLQVSVGAKPILLPVERLAVTLGLAQKMTVSRLRKWAAEDGYIRKVKAGSRAGKKADEFVFDVACCPILKDRAKAGTAELFRSTGG